MKIRTDYVTNSSSSSFVLTLLVETTNGKRIAFQSVSGEDHDYPSLSAYASPKDLGQCDSVEALVDMLKNSVCVGDDFPVLEGSAFLGKVEKIHSMDNISRITIEGYEHGGWTEDGKPYAIENRAAYDLKSHEYTVVCRGLYDEIECDIPSGELGFSFEGAEVTHIEEAPEDIDKKVNMFDVEDFEADDGPAEKPPDAEEETPEEQTSDIDMTMPNDDGGQCEKTQPEETEPQSASEEKANAEEAQTKENAEAVKPILVSEVKPEYISAPAGVSDMGKPAGPGFKIIHTSDWHFGMRVGTGNYQDCQEYFLEQLYALIRKENVGAVLCAGDIYDSGNAGADAISLFDKAAQTICGELGVPFIVIAGNHDSPERLAAHRGLLSGAGLHIFGRLEQDIQPVLLDDGKVAVYPVPYFNRYEVQALFPECQEDIHSLQDAHMVVLDHIRETMDPSLRNIVVSHAYIIGAALSESDRAAMKGLAPAISKDVYRDFDYVALGHIHKPQQVGENIRYSGSPVKYSFSEEKQEKGVVLIDTEDMSHTFVPLPLLRDRKTAEGTFAELMARTDLVDDYLRLRVTDRYSGLETYAELKERFPFLLELTGMSVEDNGEESTLTMEELETLSDEDVLKKFLAERFDYTPTEDQLALFREAMAQVEED